MKTTTLVMRFQFSIGVAAAIALSVVSGGFAEDAPTKTEVYATVSNLVARATIPEQLRIARTTLTERQDNIGSATCTIHRFATTNECAAIVILGQHGDAQDLTRLLHYLECRIQNEHVQKAKVPLLDVPMTIGGVTRTGSPSDRERYLACQAIRQVLVRGKQETFTTLVELCSHRSQSRRTMLKILSILVEMNHAHIKEFAQLRGNEPELENTKAAVIAGERGYWSPELGEEPKKP